MTKKLAFILIFSFGLSFSQNNAPVAENQTVNTDKNTEVDITLVATDSDGDILTYIIKSLPVNGTLKNNSSIITQDQLPIAVSASQIKYIPDTNFSGSDSFTFVARDLSIASFAATNGLTLITKNGIPITSDKPAGKTYYLTESSPKRMDWPDAKTLTDSFEGAQMFVPFNKSMDQAVYDALKSMGRLDGPFWYGLSQDRNASDYSEPAGGWYWVDGVKLGSTERPYTNWHSGEPNNAGGNEDYAQFNRFIGGFTWNDMQVGNTQSYALFEFSLKDDGSESNLATVTINISTDGFSIQDDNNKITVGSCTCNGKNDGSLALSIEDVRYNYTITVSGVTEPITIKGTNKTANVTGLAKGTYTVCFKVDENPVYEQCFEAVISEPNSL
jgi:hypothetical protein